MIVLVILAFLFVLATVTCAVALGIALALDGGHNAYAATRRQKPPGLRNVAAIWRVFRRIALQRFLGPPRIEVRALRDLLALSPSDFEAAAATIFRDLGYRQVAVVGGVGDYCVDIQGVDPEGRSVVFQCKRYAPGNKVGSRDVQTFIGMATVHHRADRAVFVTTSAFTPNCQKIAERSGDRLDLIDGQRLARLLADKAPGEQPSRKAGAPTAVLPTG